ncbi:NPCBM/NEW2 domain-containing protein [Streptomyces sp. NPDC005760]|uniref:NPCBM/NEW2 domain-containing protein n=1 Tax=Streptomyces sp. NPDC005760 TaxID=3156718 RepID=UPI0033FD9E9E
MAAPELQHRGLQLGHVPAHGTVLLRVSADRGWRRTRPSSNSAWTASCWSLRVSVRLSGPEDWALKATSPTSAAVLSTGRSLRTSWSVTAPQGTPTGRTPRATVIRSPSVEWCTPGTVAFEVWADGTKVASTGVLTNAMPAQPLAANITGARLVRLVRLVVTDGGDGVDGVDGVDSDHAARGGDARLSC